MPKLSRSLFWPDTHAPYHDWRAVELAIQIGREFKPDTLVFEGDFFDCYTISDYEKDPHKACNTIQQEVQESTALLLRIEKEIRPKKVVFVEGNHEDRVSRYLRKNAPKLMGLVDTRSVLGIPDRYQFVPFGPKNKYWASPKLIVTHGTRANKYCASAMVERFKVSVLFGHTHRLQEFNICTADGRRLKGKTNGWLGDLDRAAEYVNDVADWAHAITLGYFTPDGDFWLQDIEIDHQYRTVFNGKLYVAPEANGKTVALQTVVQGPLPDGKRG